MKMKDVLQTIKENNEARSNNPSQIKVNKFRWLLNYPLWPMIWMGALLFFIAMAWLIHWAFWFAVAFLALANWVYWLRVDDRFENGDTTPAIIINLDPMLIAVSTDMTKGVGSFPIIKIIEKEIVSICGKEPEVGMRLVTNCIYLADFKHTDRWKNFDPRPVDCVCDNHYAKLRLLNSFHPQEWQDMEDQLKQIPQPYECGLYPIGGWDED